MYFKSSLLFAMVAGLFNTAAAYVSESAQLSQNMAASLMQSKESYTNTYFNFNADWLESSTWKDVYCKIFAYNAQSSSASYACMRFKIWDHTMFSANWLTLAQSISESGDSYVDIYLQDREIIILTHTKLQGSETELLPLARDRFRLDSEEDMKSLYSMYLFDNPWICIIPDLQGNAYRTLQNLKDLQIHIPYTERLSINIIPLIVFGHFEKERARSPKELKRMEQSHAIVTRIFKDETVESVLRQCQAEIDALDNAPLKVQTVIVER